jgi:shikimate dehydrogenase
MIKATTKCFGVIGDPIGHSLSPLMQGWFFDRFKIDAAYLAFHVQSARLKACVEGMKALGIHGLNVTIPHKEAVLAYVDDKSPDVIQLNAANVLKNEDSGVVAYVTDPLGFIESLGVEKDRFTGATILLFGAGGAGKSVAFAAWKLGAQKLFIVDQSHERAHSLADLARNSFGISQVEVLAENKAAMNEAIHQSSVIINATPMGMHPNEDSSAVQDFAAFSKKHFVYDLVYNPGLTRFLAEAKAKGSTIQSGLDMLIFQGLEALRIWTDESLELDAVSLKQVRKLLMSEMGIHE